MFGSLDDASDALLTHVTRAWSRLIDERDKDEDIDAPPFCQRGSSIHLVNCSNVMSMDVDASAFASLPLSIFNWLRHDIFP